ncbi:hypothetical protein CC1G_08722 [Coprinopsis cinerea okayama7|uniref:Uncharacterized protein n=1 Tax=Coprinopsis cinerea (strain Okayama-7 / 130 / ATCC MYA-4618 / FGSC 9003) TaxID=240176 RepID=A8NIX1_COPC7|nr:hypothetical protein CC1G_08722 [Coprinopsis cinerea okayama7\|eukprot:XP_001834091.2 hypothetical protein CC1G_08722 [Coprinopsis cinerea okayama7\
MTIKARSFLLDPTQAAIVKNGYWVRRSPMDCKEVKPVSGSKGGFRDLQHDNNTNHGLYTRWQKTGRGTYWRMYYPWSEVSGFQSVIPGEREEIFAGSELSPNRWFGVDRWGRTELGTLSNQKRETLYKNKSPKVQPLKPSSCNKSVFEERKVKSGSRSRATEKPKLCQQRTPTPLMANKHKQLQGRVAGCRRINPGFSEFHHSEQSLDGTTDFCDPALLGKSL